MLDHPNAACPSAPTTAASQFWARSGRRRYSLDLSNASLPSVSGLWVLTLLKETEPFGYDQAVQFFGFGISSSSIRAVPSSFIYTVPSPAGRPKPMRIDVYGDSDSTAFGVDGDISEPLR